MGAVSVVHPARRQYMLDLSDGNFIPAMLGFDLSAFAPRVPDPKAARPLIVHAPSRRLIKGTERILAAIETLRVEGLVFDFRLIEGCEHRAALEAMHPADVFVDSLIMGNYGLAAIEAMSMGKPVVCYVKEGLRREYPASLPIVQAEPGSLATILRDLLSNGEKRALLGRESRAYVEQFHDAHKNARAMVSAYETVIAERSRSAHAAEGILSR